MVNKTSFHSIAYFVSKNESFKEGYFKNICHAEKPNESFSNKPEKKVKLKKNLSIFIHHSKHKVEK